MSSNAYSATLQADSRLRQWVLGSGGVLLLAGVLAILVVPASWFVRAIAALAWVAIGARELIYLHGKWRTYTAIRVMADGAVSVRHPAGEWDDARLLPGSVLLKKYAWIRLQLAGGQVVAEPLKGARRDDRDWRRLHVLWPHIGAPD